MIRWFILRIRCSLKTRAQIIYKVKHDILMNMEARRVKLLIVPDLSAAFDTMHHHVLLNRLQAKFGVVDKALKWFTSYLADRSQYVAVNGGISSIFPLKYGVPQSSCLGPILFTIYTSKLFEILSCILHLTQTHKMMARPLLMPCGAASMRFVNGWLMTISGWRMIKPNF